MKLFANLLLAAMVATCAARAWAEPRPAAALMAKTFLDIFNRGDRSAYEAFLHAHGPAPDFEFAASRAQTGGYDLVDIQTATDSVVIETVKARLADDYLRFELEVDPGQGHAIKRLSFTPASRPGRVPPPIRVPTAKLATLVDNQLRALGDFSGAVLIAEHGRPVYVQASGLADRAHLLPNTPETRFRMASMGKMFTAVAVLQLVQAGKLDLDAPIGTYLRDYPNAAFARSVTARQLLTHTGGAGDFMSQTWADNYQRLNAPADYITLFGNRPPQFEPGSRYAYANYGYVVLGRIVEVVSGEAYDDYLRDHIFRPAGMTHSGLNAEPIGASILAVRYVKTPDGFQPPPAPFSGAATPAGGAYSTVGDMLAFANALTGHRLLDVAHTELLITGKVKGEDSVYAYGFEDRSAGGVRDVGHDGGGPGENGGFRILNDGEAVVVVLSNVAPTWRADKLCAFIAARAPLSAPATAPSAPRVSRPSVGR